MIAVIFEVWPAEGEEDRYLELAAAIKDELSGVDGFLSVERFRSIAEPEKMLSLSFFRDEAAVKDWRNRPHHRATQGRGRGGVFKDYRLRIASVMRDYGMNEREQAPADSRAAHQA
jgi:heme-degrading monooxygenase HmoA